MRPFCLRRELTVAGAAAALTGCLLTSDFDGIASGTVAPDARATPPPDSSAPPLDAAGRSSDAADDASVISDAADARGPATPWPCTGRFECLTFESALPGTDTGWYTQQTRGGTVSHDTVTFASGAGALRARIAADPTAAEPNAALLYKTVTHDTPVGHLLWGFDANLGACASTLSTQSFTLAAIGPGGSAVYGVVAAAEGDLIVVRPDADAGPVLNYTMPALPRGAWLHLDFDLRLGSIESTFRVVLDGVLVRELVLPAAPPSDATLLNVGLYATSPTEACDAVYDNYYFDRSAD